MRAQEFLNRYRVLEELLSAKYSSEPRKHSSVVMEFIADAESAPCREQLDLCREIRNLITHNADCFGEVVVEPSQGVLESLDRIIEYVQRPPLALDFATPPEKILWAHMRDRVGDIMRTMEGRGFSHVPVSDGKGFCGVFSVSTVFSYVLDRRMPSEKEDLRIEDFGKLLPIECHLTERFLFVDKKTTYYDIKHEFEKTGPRCKRLAAVFITQSGAQKEPLMGIVTPWDALRYKP